MAGGEKTCVFCGKDCANRPRVKDAQGRYACRDCADARAKSPSRAPDVLDLVAHLDAPSEPEIYAIEEPPPKPVRPPVVPADGIRSMQACPKCGKAILTDQKVCVDCGTDLRSGKRLKTQRQGREPREAPPPPTASQLGMAAAGSAIGAVVGLGLWLAVSSATGASARSMVFLVGAGAAAPALFPVRGAGSFLVGAITAGVAFLVIGIGLVLTPDGQTGDFEWVTAQPGQGSNRTQAHRVVGIDEGRDLIFEGAWMALGVLTAFGLGSTNPYEEDDA